MDISVLSELSCSPRNENNKKIKVKEKKSGNLNKRILSLYYLLGLHSETDTLNILLKLFLVAIHCNTPEVQR